ncbi:hypothetical protein H6758_01430 [Candidatus Nomurabacteria bacterium]|nr:hypothetical protein [Candidatus Nomurabacteria bacterium]
MKFLQETTWSKVFEGWAKREASNPDWVNCATQVKGWPDWYSWREFSASLFHADQRKWKMFQFENPMEEIPQMLLGPYTGWQDKFDQKNVATFADLYTPEMKVDPSNPESAIGKIYKGLPFSTELIGLEREDGNIVCIDGHHRAAAIALAAHTGENIDFSDVQITIALAPLSQGEYILLDQMLKRGSSKEL